ncbi:MAG: KamA family radical SAM protein [Spirochaetales bacterium]|nr:KamA family radical SAM protein [Spirochaetales bacterium]
MGDQNLTNDTEKPPSGSLAWVDSEEPPSLKTGTLGNTGGRAVSFLPFEFIIENRKKSFHRAFSLHPGTDKFVRDFFPGTAPEEWTNWKWQLANRIKGYTELDRFLKLTEAERRYFKGDLEYQPLSITPYYLSLINPALPEDPIRKMVVPTIDETVVAGNESIDPLGEDEDSPVPGIIHRYADRVLFLVTNFCSTFCRYCTRTRLVVCREDSLKARERWQRCIDYIARHRKIRDVLVSGGDPLTLSDNAVNWLLSGLRAIPHVEIIRIGTKVPAVLPFRITASLKNILRKYHPLYINIHFSHPGELTGEAKTACTMLADAGIPLGSQTVLLAGVNDDVATMTALMHGLLQVRVKPYYLYQCDLVPGTGHFRTPVSRGLEIMRGLRGHTSGLAVPTYVIDAPHGGGKIPMLPEYVCAETENGYHFRNYMGREIVYPHK